ncbi:MAG TPA: glycosyltransferase family 2 protein [archaeon]|nr:glycosyltransferase family 2 protein [archaeon]
MYKNLKIGVVVPAYNEEELIPETLGGMPVYVDRIFVVNDGSTDRTKELIQQQKNKDPRIQLIDHKANQGLGQSLIDGYIASKNSDIDITAVMDGDNQMHPDDLPGLLDLIIEKNYDYVKGNRLLHQNISLMPTYRFLGNSVLTILTKFATGYYSLMDPQCAYTVIKNSTLRQIPIETMTRGYGYNADILCMLNIQRFRATNIKVQPVYGREKSKIKLWKYIPKTSWLLIRLFFRRLWQRYVVRDFHPLVLFYLFAFFNMIFIILPFTARFFYLYLTIGEAPKTTMLILVFTILITFQSILFAIWMDMDYNKD